MTCTTTGGTVLSGSLTGPGRVNIVNFSPVGTRNYRARTATEPVLVLGQEAVMETLTSAQQLMEFPHLMEVAVQPSEV